MAGARDRRAYRRTHDVAAAGKPAIAGSSDPAFRGTMTEHADGSGLFTAVVLRPHVTIAPGSDAGLAQRLHDAVDELCFIARSVNFPVWHQPTTAVAG